MGFIKIFARPLHDLLFEYTAPSGEGLLPLRLYLVMDGLHADWNVRAASWGVLEEKNVVIVRLVFIVIVGCALDRCVLDTSHIFYNKASSEPLYSLG